MKMHTNYIHMTPAQETLEIRVPEIKNHKTSDTLKEVLSKAQKAVIFSPHFDDAVLSMGSTLSFLLASGIEVEVVTIFTKGSKSSSPLTQKLLHQAGIHDSAKYFEARRQENETAITSLGAIHIRNLSFIDAAWRATNAGKMIYPETTLGEISMSDESLREELSQNLKKIDISKNTLVFAPVAQGKHVDHQLTRDACLNLPQSIFYQDFPYSSTYGNEKDFITKHALVGIEWQEDYYEKKALSIFAYTTQLKSLFPKNSLILPLEHLYVRSGVA